MTFVHQTREIEVFVNFSEFLSMKTNAMKRSCKVIDYAQDEEHQRGRVGGGRGHDVSGNRFKRPSLYCLIHFYKRQCHLVAV